MKFYPTSLQYDKNWQFDMTASKMKIKKKVELKQPPVVNMRITIPLKNEDNFQLTDFAAHSALISNE